MEKVDHISRPLQLDGLAKEEAKVIKDVRLDKKEIDDLRSAIEEEEKQIEEEIKGEIEDNEVEEIEEEKEEDEDEDVYKDLLLHPKVTSWIKDETGETVHGIQVKHVPLSTNSKRIEFDLCPICVKPWTPHDKTHQISSLPCGHMFGLSCLKKWIKDRNFNKCPQCYENFSLESVTHLYAPRFCIQAAVAQKVDYISLFELDEAEKEVAEMEFDLDDDDDDDFEKVEDLSLPLVSKWDSPNDGPPLYGLEVPVMKDDEFILDSMYRNDIDIDIDVDDDDDDDPPLPPHVFDTLPPPPAPVCSICFKDWTPLHYFCFLPCGHIFGFQCIQKWLQTNHVGMCPQCKALCSLKDVRTLNATCLSIPAADKGVADPEISTRRFTFTRHGFIKFRKFESGRRNFALKKRSDAKKRLAGVVGRKNDLMKCRTDLLDRRASVLNRAKALEKQGGSLRLRADALRLRADALGRWADEYLRQVKACEERAKALGQRARAYNQRAKSFEARVSYFRQSYDNHHDNFTTPCAAAATCHKD